MELRAQKNQNIKSNSTVKTFKEIFENTYYDDKYIFFHVTQLHYWGHDEVVELLNEFPGKDRFAGAFITIAYDNGPETEYHSVCMIPDGENFLVYDGNHELGNDYLRVTYELQDDCLFKKIQEITYVYSPKKFNEKV